MPFRQVSRRSSPIVLLLGCLLLAGCDSSDPPEVFEPNLVHSMKYEITQNVPMDEATRDVHWSVTELFGTPDDPRLPEVVKQDDELSSLLSMERLQMASGADDSSGRGLYRKHCKRCHGTTGNGRGPQASVQTPYPRDYRLGIFKFKSTPRGVKPTRDDLARTIANGIAGTAMNKIAELSDEDVQALVDYVIYLSWRGEYERMMIDDGLDALDLEAGERIIDRDFAAKILEGEAFEKKLADIAENKIDAKDLREYENYLEIKERIESDPELEARLKADPEEADSEEAEESDPDAEQLAEDRDKYKDYVDLSEDLAEDAELKQNLEQAHQETSPDELEDYDSYTEAIEVAEDILVDIGESWLEAGEEVLEVPDPPAGLPVAESRADFEQLMRGDEATALSASVDRGRELFVGKIASCSKCHGEKGLGDGQTTDYDDWVKDWTTRVDLKPDDRESLIPLLARGALPPRNAIPRNFQEGIFRGGSRPEDLYRRITQGIDGTPMPAATFVEGQFEQDDVWHLINFIRSLQQTDAEPGVEGSTEATAESEQADQSAA